MARRVRPRSRWRRHRRNRRLIAAGLIVAGCAALLIDVRGPVSAPGIPVALAARDIRSGSVLQPGDVLVSEVPADSPMSAVAVPAESVVGRTAVGDLLAGEMVTGSRLIDQAVRPGFATMPVSFTDPELTPFLTPGMRIDIVWTPDDLSGGTPAVVAQDARVLRVGAGPDSPGGPGSGVPVLLEVAEPDTVRLAGAMGSGSLSVLVR